jgi:hypothetical protein
MERRYGFQTVVDCGSPDPTNAINAFLHNMNKARSLGMIPRTEHVLAEHLFRGDAKVIFYSSLKGVMSIVADDEILSDDDDLEFLKWIVERKKAHLQRRREKAAIAVETVAQHFADTADGVPAALPERPVIEQTEAKEGQ